MGLIGRSLRAVYQHLRHVTLYGLRETEKNVAFTVCFPTAVCVESALLSGFSTIGADLEFEGDQRDTDILNEEIQRCQEAEQTESEERH